MSDRIIISGGGGTGEIGLQPRVYYGEISIAGNQAPPLPEYAGPYTVVPVLNRDQVLETAEKRMREDVTVKPIPVVQTTNPYGGQTVVIG